MSHCIYDAQINLQRIEMFWNGYWLEKLSKLHLTTMSSNLSFEKEEVPYTAARNSNTMLHIIPRQLRPHELSMPFVIEETHSTNEKHTSVTNYPSYTLSEIHEHYNPIYMYTFSTLTDYGVDIIVPFAYPQYAFVAKHVKMSQCMQMITRESISGAHMESEYIKNIVLPVYVGDVFVPHGNVPDKYIRRKKILQLYVPPIKEVPSLYNLHETHWLTGVVPNYLPYNIIEHCARYSWFINTPIHDYDLKYSNIIQSPFTNEYQLSDVDTFVLYDLDQHKLQHSMLRMSETTLVSLGVTADRLLPVVCPEIFECCTVVKTILQKIVTSPMLLIKDRILDKYTDCIAQNAKPSELLIYTILRLLVEHHSSQNTNEQRAHIFDETNFNTSFTNMCTAHDNIYQQIVGINHALMVIFPLLVNNFSSIAKHINLSTENEFLLILYQLVLVVSFEHVIALFGEYPVSTINNDWSTMCLTRGMRSNCTETQHLEQWGAAQVSELYHNIKKHVRYLMLNMYNQEIHTNSCVPNFAKYTLAFRKMTMNYVNQFFINHFMSALQRRSMKVINMEQNEIINSNAQYVVSHIKDAIMSDMKKCAHHALFDLSICHMDEMGNFQTEEFDLFEFISVVDQLHASTILPSIPRPRINHYSVFMIGKYALLGNMLPNRQEVIREWVYSGYALINQQLNSESLMALANKYMNSAVQIAYKQCVAIQELSPYICALMCGGMQFLHNK